MLGELTRDEIEGVLARGTVGRIGCHANGRTYVVPVTYVYDGDDIYGHTAEGMKVRMMRENPHICFEVDEEHDLANWKSVIAWGTYEELEGEEAIHAMQLLVTRLASKIPVAAGAAPLPIAGHGTVLTGKPAIIYRINLREKTGRFEQV